MNPFQKLMHIVHGLNSRFPNGQNPFQIITRLAEETGELAKEINHFQATGIKLEKYREPNKEHLAKEVQDVLRSALAIAVNYKIEDELLESIETSFQKLKTNGYIKE